MAKRWAERNKMRYYFVNNTVFAGYADEPVLILDNLNSYWIKKDALLKIMDGTFRNKSKHSNLITTYRNLDARVYNFES